MKSILCLIDLTESSAGVLTLAARMALALKARLIILFPYRLIDYSHKSDASRLRASLEEKAREDFASLKKKVGVLDTVQFDFNPEIGFAGNIMSVHVRRNKTDMIVIGQRHAESIGEGSGDTLEDLIKSLRTPFTIVPEEIDVEILSS